jgi:tRNA(fMet)-specific endonuclease VapC
MVCLDTSVIVALLRKDESATSKFEEAVAGGAMVSTTVVNLCELYAGAYGARRASQELEKVEGLTSLLQVLDLDAAAAKRYGELVNFEELKHKPIGDFDVIIAAIAMSNDEPVATRDLDHFSRVPGLSVDRW